ncbi:MAG: hypothetical protein ABIS38_06945 [Sphingomicrobium sp.]
MKIPKPRDGWRVFAGEVGVIVLGVLLALGAQQVVENRADRVRADSAIVALRAEAAESDFAANEIEITRPCVLTQLDAIEKRMVVGNRALLPLFSDNVYSANYVVRTPSRGYPDGAWQSVSTTDVLRRLESKKERYISAFYAQLATQRLDSMRVRASVHELNVLGYMVPAGEAERMRLITTIERLRGDIGHMDLVAGQLRDSLAAAGLLASKSFVAKNLGDSGTIKFCRAHEIALGKVRPAIAANAD